MGYLVRTLKFKTRSWKVIYQSRKGGVRREHDIKEGEYIRLGFHRNMDLEAVRQRVTQLNSQEKLKRIEENRRSIDQRLKEEDLKTHALLPKSLEDEFADIHLTGEKSITIWRTARKLIMKVNLEPHHWNYQKIKWFKVMNGYSFSYIQKLIHILNQWGKFLAYKHGTYFEPMPSPRGHEKQRIIDSTESQASVPLTPEMLESVQSQLNPLHYNWLFISVWLGLRPYEIDNLNSKTYRVEGSTLWVYQSKLSGIRAADRWKPIPLLYKEQKECLKLIRASSYKRPLNKTLKKLFNDQLTGYAGRKGFTDLMMSKGHNLEATSQWMGHQSIERTWKSYKDKKKVLL